MRYDKMHGRLRLLTHKIKGPDTVYIIQKGMYVSGIDAESVIRMWKHVFSYDRFIHYMYKIQKGMSFDDAIAEVIKTNMEKEEHLSRVMNSLKSYCDLDMFSVINGK